MPPLDRMRKIRRDIVKTINDLRETINVPGIVIDILSNKAANEYAEYLLGNGEEEEKVKDFMNKHLIVGEVKTLVGVSMLEEEDNEDKVLYNEFMDAHGLLCELEEERNILLDPKYTHIGVGFAWSGD